MPLKDFIQVLFGSYNRENNQKSYSDPVFPQTDMELKMLDYIYSSPFIVSLHKDEYILNTPRFKRILKVIGISGNKSAIRYLNKVKINGKRFIIQENILSLYLHKDERTEDKVQIWNRAYMEMADVIEKAGFGKIEMEDFTHAGTAYDMAVIFYVTTLCFIVGYLNIIEYNCYCSYSMNTCRDAFNSKDEYCKSYLIGKGLSEVNGTNIGTCAIILSEKMKQK